MKLNLFTGTPLARHPSTCPLQLKPDELSANAIDPRRQIADVLMAPVIKSRLA